MHDKPDPHHHRKPTLHQALRAALPGQEEAKHLLESQFGLFLSGFTTGSTIHPHPVLLMGNQPGSGPPKLLAALASHAGLPLDEIHLASGFSVDAVLTSLLRRNPGYAAGQPLGMVLLSGLELLTEEQAMQLSHAINGDAPLPQVFRGNTIMVSPRQVFWAAVFKVPEPSKSAADFPGSPSSDPDRPESGIGATCVLPSPSGSAGDAAGPRHQRLLQHLRSAFKSEAWLLPPTREDLLALLDRNHPHSPLPAYDDLCRKHGVELVVEQDACEALVLAAERQGGSVESLEAVLRAALDPAFASITDHSVGIAKVRLTAEAVRGDSMVELVAGQRGPVAVKPPGAGDDRFPEGLPARPARTVASNPEIRLARESDLAPILTKPKPTSSKERPFNDYPLVIPGFTALVEAVADGSVLKALPQQDLRIPGKISRLSTLVLGLPGSGKTKRLLERGVSAALREPETSVVVFAVQPGSMRQAVAAARHYRGRKARVARFNPGDPANCTHRINPLAGVTGQSAVKDMVQTLSQSAQDQATTGDSIFFIQHAVSMITHTIMAMQELNDGHANLRMVKQCIDGGGRKLLELAQATDSEPLRNFAHDILSDSRNPQTTLIQMANILEAWDDEGVGEATSRNELDFDELLIRKPGLLVISVDEEHVGKLSALTSLFFRNFFAWIIRTSRRHPRGQLPRHLFIFIDELPAAGRIPDFGKRLTATFRKSNVSLMAAAQCEAQLVETYRGDAASVIAGFGSRIYVPPVEMSDAERYCSRSGLIEVTHSTTTPDGRILTSAPVIRPLVLPGEMGAPNHPVLGPRILFQFAGMHPFMGYLAGSWEDETERRVALKAAKLRLPVQGAPFSYPPGNSSEEGFGTEEDEDENDSHPF